MTANDCACVCLTNLQLFRDSRYRVQRTEVEGNMIRELTNKRGVASIVISALSKDQYKAGVKPPHFRQQRGRRHRVRNHDRDWRCGVRMAGLCEIQKNRGPGR